MASIEAISILSKEEVRVIKQITIISEFANNREYSIGYILYERELSDTYKFREIDKERRDFSNYLEYPRQDNYPNDNLDEIILQSVRNTFPKSTSRNYYLISNLDRDRINVLKNRKSEQSEIIFAPDFSEVDPYESVGQLFKELRKHIKIYNDFTKESIQNLFFQGYYNIEDKQILNKLDKIVFI